MLLNDEFTKKKCLVTIGENTFNVYDSINWMIDSFVPYFVSRIDSNFKHYQGIVGCTLTNVPLWEIPV